ncbi:hypothetical protein RV12_GL002770 [Enterococcus quebecensis]|nr:hypothetical protein RV12_GL002770 [Enterococcus quebecensis]
MLLFIFYATSAIFILRYTTSWILMALTLFLINSLTILSWLFTYDLVNFLFQLHYLNADQRQFLVPFSLLGQQVCFFLLILGVKKIDKMYLISDSILHIHKNYKLHSLIALFFLILFALIKQLAINYFFVESFFYLTFLLLTLNLIVYSTAYLYSKYYQQQLKKDVLFEQYNQELEKITISDEFRHDYRNILLSLADYIEKGETKEALNYISSITDYSTELLEDDPYAELSNISIPSVQGLLIYLIESCKNEEIQLHLSIPDMITEKDISIRLIDFINCLSILMDFSVEATTTKNLYLSIKKIEQQLIFKIENTLKQLPANPANSKSHFKKKKINTVKKILNQYNEANFFFHSENDDFIVEFSLHTTK